MTYYSDGRITYQRAEEEVQEFVREKDTKTFVTAAQICRNRGIEPSQHNQHRVHKALSSEYEQADEWSSKPQKFKIER